MGLSRSPDPQLLVNCRRLEWLKREPATGSADVFLQFASRLVLHKPADDCCGLDTANERAVVFAGWGRRGKGLLPRETGNWFNSYCPLVHCWAHKPVLAQMAAEPAIHVYLSKASRYLKSLTAAS